MGTSGNSGVQSGWRKPGAWRWVLLATVIGFVGGLFAIAGLFLIAPTKLVTPHGGEYASSLVQKAGNGGGYCDPNGAGTYRCGVELDGGSGIGAIYELTTEGDSCWSAQAVNVNGRKRGEKGPRRTLTPTDRPAIDGCVGVSDFVFPDDVRDEYGTGTD